ncbi:MAG: bifunctional 3-phenylpropionate/cinnamic acid dioxygenase ferredoxin subunit [Deltaproteobacteria bacterium]|nr:bifunctional 3-phenylpropionate/cinnamic acid dioxygenase ferredoxin subunit [Deltaproteobacteria bacterium]
MDHGPKTKKTTQEYAVAKVNEISPGTAKQVEVGEDTIAIFNVNGKFYAIADTCTHAHASLSEGEVEDHTVTCPLHGAQFDIRTGKNLCLPAVEPVQKYNLKIEDDVIKIVL